MTPKELVDEFGATHERLEGAELTIACLKDDISKQEGLISIDEKRLTLIEHEWLKSHRCVCGLVGLVCECSSKIEIGGEA